MPNEKPEYVTIARIRRTQGRVGEVLASIETDFPERFDETRSVALLDRAGNRRTIEIERHWFHKGGVVLKVAGIDDISAAETLAGAEVQIPLAERHALEPGSFYMNDLEGCRVIERGVEIGRVRFFDPTVGTPVLVVDTPEGELLVPFAEGICKRIDPAAGCIEVELPEGLRDLNK